MSYIWDPVWKEKTTRGNYQQALIYVLQLQLSTQLLQ